MKTAISLPDELFRRAEKVARKLRISRSELYATAVAEYLNRQDEEAITAQLNAVYSREGNVLDPALHRAQLNLLEKDRW